jgi:2'-5' RNA ligase
MQRLFFALWPNEEVRAAIFALSSDLPLKTGRRVRPDNLHITLVFLGNVHAEMRACVEAIADDLTATAFDLQLDTLGWWSKPRVLWLAPSRVPQELSALAARLGTGIARCGQSLDKREYRPHMTLVRKVNRPLRLGKINMITWRARHFCLIRSKTEPMGVVYEMVKSWQLH